jgi:hypothetical protein
MTNVIKFPQKRFAGSLNEAIDTCMVDGALMISDMDNLPAVATNGGTKCDVVTGFCSCGAHHSKGDSRNWTDEYIGYCRMNGKEPGE